MHDYCVRRPAGVGDLPIKIWPRFRLAGGEEFQLKTFGCQKIRSENYVGIRDRRRNLDAPNKRCVTGDCLSSGHFDF